MEHRQQKNCHSEPRHALKNPANRTWQLMPEIVYPMSVVIDKVLILSIMILERRWDFEDRNFC